ncbi:MerR family transcriptional regulator [Pedobacter cryophilus]|uniref:MerR family transcriptional regulator n=1 Tax=Pedobacter cryophilus TaxID=2571271 RepID=UPI00145F9484|nr:MerR family transcriptional regulator [Pedobacter cryophilus]
MKKFSISDIENLTGIKAHTIRVWEQRYNFFTTKRTDTNIRYYDDADLCMFLNIATLNENGYKISKISKMDIDEINNLVKRLKEDHYNANVQVQMLSNAMLKMDDDEFDEILTGCVNDMGMEASMADIIFPFLRKVGFMWQVGSINPAHEHFATHKIGQKLIQQTYLHKKPSKHDSKRYLLFLPPNETHEVGLLFAQYLLKANGHQTLYLGQNLPFESIAEVNAYFEPDFAFSVLTVSNSDNNIDVTVKKLRENLGNTPLILAGNQVSYHNICPQENLILIKNIKEFTQITEKLGMSIAS